MNLDYNWDKATRTVRQGEAAKTQGDHPKDWFAARNMNEMVQVFDLAGDIQSGAVDLVSTHESIEAGILTDDVLEYEVEAVRDTLKDMKSDLQDLFSVLEDLVETGFDNVVDWAGQTGGLASIDNQRYRPDKMSNRQQHRLEAKRWALIKSYIDPLLKRFSVPYVIQEPDDFSKKLQQTGEAIDAFLRWLWECFKDIKANADTQGTNPANYLHNLLRSEGTVRWDKLVARLHGAFDDQWTDEDIMSLCRQVEEMWDCTVKVWEDGNVMVRQPQYSPLEEDLQVELLNEPDAVEWNGAHHETHREYVLDHTLSV